MEALLTGLVLGLGSGVSPGPLLALAISTTVRRGLRAGLVVTAAPLVTDTLFIVLTVTVISQLSTSVIAGLSLVGAVVIAWFAWENAREARTADVSALRCARQSSGRLTRLTRQPLLQAVAVNVLNPAPWLFWISAGAPILIGFAGDGLPLAIAFLVAFYVAIIGSKALLVVAIAAGRHRLGNHGYRLILAGVSVLLAVIAIVLTVNGIRTLLD